MTDTEDKRGPGLKFPPPLLPLAVVGTAYCAELIYTLPITGNGAPWRSGAAVIGLAFTLALAALLQFIGAKTHVEPWHPTTTIIRHGPYRFSRNPIYLAFCVAALGCGLVLNSWWIVLAVPILVYLLQALVIRREEIYLEQKFGEEYLAYKRSVRRWL